LRSSFRSCPGGRWTGRLTGHGKVLAGRSKQGGNAALVWIGCKVRVRVM
jgi:hypothetical protein